MSYVAPDPEQPALAAEAAADPAERRAERRLGVLEEMTEIGMRLMRALERRVLAEDEAAQGETTQGETTGSGADEAAAGPAQGHTEGRAQARAWGRDPADAFSRLSRAIRLTLMLEARTDEALRDLKAGVVRAPGRPPAAERFKTAAQMERERCEAFEARREAVRGLIRQVADVRTLHPGHHSELFNILEDRLIETGDCGESLDRETLERLYEEVVAGPTGTWDGIGPMPDFLRPLPTVGDEAGAPPADPATSIPNFGTNLGPAHVAAHALE